MAVASHSVECGVRAAALRMGGRCALLHSMTLCGLVAAGCAGHADRTKDARSALDAGRPREALAALNEQLEVDSAKEVPDTIEDDHILFILDRSIVLQQLDMYALSSRDLELADKRIEVLDFSRSSLDDISKYMFSDDAGPYQAPAYEKLLINTMNMVNYLARGDLNGARIEARRFGVMQRFISEHESHGKSLSGPGSYLSGFVFEHSNQPGEALRYYDEALQYGAFASLTEPVRRLSQRDSYSSPRLRALLDQASAPQNAEAEFGEVLVVVNYGRVPAKIAHRVPIGLALTLASTYMSPADRSKANYLAAQGLVTWVNYPTLGKPSNEWGAPEFFVDSGQLPLEGMLAVDLEAKRAWKEAEGAVVASAITRLLTRVVAGETTRRAAGGGVVGALLSLGTQATLTATDTPDTRSWSTLPARIAFGRARVPPGKRVIRLRVHGVEKRQVIDVPKGGWAVVPLTVLH
jgi:hypothetical protein